MFALAGFKRINSWERNKPETWRIPAAADPEYQKGHNALIAKLKDDAKTTHATRNPDGSVEKYYMKHTILAPEADPRSAVVAKSAWQYERDLASYDVGRLTTLIPSGYSTDETAEEIKKTGKR